MPDNDRRTPRRTARPRRRHELTASRGYVTMPNVAPYRVTIDHHERESIMRELFALIKAAADLGLYKLKVRIDDLFTDYRDPFDVGDLFNEPAELVPDGDDARDVAGIDPTEVTGPQVEAFLGRVANLDATLGPIPPSMVAASLVAVYGFELHPWQHDLLVAYYGEQVQA